MLTTARLVGTALLAVLVSGCSLDSIWNDGPVRPVSTVAATATPTATETATAEEPAQDTYTGGLASKATCARASKILLNELEDTAGVGAAITYPQGMVVKSVHGWWTVAVATAVHANSDGYTRETVPAVAYFAATGSHPADGVDVSRKAPAGTASAKKALACLKKLPPVRPDPKADHVLPFHLAMAFAGLPPAVSISPPTYRSVPITAIAAT